MANYNPYEAPGAGHGAPAPSPFQGGGEPITPLMIEHLRAARPWIRFLSILAFILSGLMLLGGLSMLAVGAIGASLGPKPASGADFTPALLGILYLTFSVVYLLPALFMHRFANSIDELVLAPGARAMENTLDRCRSFWKLAGIMALIMIALTILFFVSGMAVAVVAAAKINGSP